MAFQSRVGRNLVLISTLVVFFISCESGRQVDPVGTTDATINAGNIIYQDRCATCHGTNGRAGISGATDLSKSNLSDDMIKQIVLNGQNGMPPFKLFIKTDKEMEEVIEKVKSFRGE